MTMKVTESRRVAVSLLTALTFLSGAAVAPAQDAARTESPESIRAAAEAFVKTQLPHEANVASVTAGTLDSRLRLARCTGRLNAQLPAGAAMQSRTMVGVGCEGPVRWRVYVPVTVESRISVLILKHPVPREARLTIEDVTIETRKVTGLATAFLTDVSDLRARSVERPLPMGTTLTMDMFKPDLVIRHGQEVTLIAAAGGIEVRATGKALADAAGGTRLKVQNLSSLKVVEGVVEGPDLVRVSQ